MLCAFLNLLTALEDQGDDAGELVDESAAVGKLSLYGLATVGALGFEFQTCTYAKFAVDFRTVGAESRLVGSTVANLTVKQLLKLLLGLLQFSGMLLVR